MKCLVCQDPATRDVETEVGIFTLCQKKQCEKDLKSYVDDKESMAQEFEANRFMEYRVRRP